MKSIEKFKDKNYTLVVILLLVVLSPIILNILLLTDIGIPIAGSHNGWLAYSGSLVGALITLFVLQQTINRNHKENQSNRKLQILLLQNQYKKERLLLLEDALFEYQTSLNSIELLNILEKIKKREYIDTKKKLQNMGLETDRASFKIDLYLPNLATTEAEIKFTNVFNELNIQYQMLIADSMFFIDLMSELPEDNIQEYISYHIDRSIQSDNHLKFMRNIKTISQIIKDKGEYPQIRENSEDIINQRIMNSIGEISENIEKLKPAICSLINDKFEAIELKVHNL